MDIQEVIRRVEVAFGYATAIHEDWGQDDDAEKLAIEALRKQEPMKPIIEQGAPSYYASTGICRDYCVCPKCGEEVGRGDDRVNYCPECGQRIGWRTK